MSAGNSGEPLPRGLNPIAAIIMPGGPMELPTFAFDLAKAPAFVPALRFETELLLPATICGEVAFVAARRFVVLFVSECPGVASAAVLVGDSTAATLTFVATAALVATACKSA